VDSPSLSRVAVIPCPDYSPERVSAAVEAGLNALGGPGRFTAPGEKILIKPNLLAGDAPDRAVTVHPEVFSAVARTFQVAGARVSYGDSPARGRPERIARATGIAAAADALDIPLADFNHGESRPLQGPFQDQSIRLANGVIEADGMISISKMKTHALTRITGAVKNTYGVIPGLQKGELHLRYPDVFRFSELLAAVLRLAEPRLHIMDGIMAMEGNGPRGGTPRKMGVLLFSIDPVALDAVFCRLVHMNPEHVPYMEAAQRAGVGTMQPSRIRILGGDPDSFSKRDFQVPRRPPPRFLTSTYLPRFMREWVTPRPVIDSSRCRNCGACVAQCPVTPRALAWPQDGPSEALPVYNYEHCIRCYCCQEICPEKAIRVHVPVMGRLLYRK